MIQILPFVQLRCCAGSWRNEHLDGFLWHLQTLGIQALQIRHPRYSHPISSPHLVALCGVSHSRTWWRFLLHKTVSLQMPHQLRQSHEQMQTL